MSGPEGEIDPATGTTTVGSDTPTVLVPAFPVTVTPGGSLYLNENASLARREGDNLIVSTYIFFIEAQYIDYS